MAGSALASLKPFDVYGALSARQGKTGTSRSASFSASERDFIVHVLRGRGGRLLMRPFGLEAERHELLLRPLLNPGAEVEVDAVDVDRARVVGMLLAFFAIIFEQNAAVLPL